MLALVASGQSGHTLSASHIIIVFTIGLAAHISVNAFNEYFDFRSGLDFLTKRTPFSGGSGTLIQSPHASHIALSVAVMSLTWVIVGGVYLSYTLGVELLLIGVPGVLLIYGYTQHINRWPIWCLLAPGVGFGLFMTLGAFWVFTGTVTALAWIIAGVVTGLASNLLLLNQFPDVEADAKVGRRHLPILIGRRKSARLFQWIYGLEYLLLALALMSTILPWPCVLVLATMPLAWQTVRGVHRYADDVTALVPYLGRNVALCHLVPLLLIIGLWLDWQWLA